MLRYFVGESSVIPTRDISVAWASDLLRPTDMAVPRSQAGATSLSPNAMADIATRCSCRTWLDSTTQLVRASVDVLHSIFLCFRVRSSFCWKFVYINTLRCKLSESCYSCPRPTRGTRGPCKVRDNMCSTARIKVEMPFRPF